MNWETLLCLGDSITIGSRSYLGYPEYCGNYLKEQTGKNWNIYNCAVAGFTTIDLVRFVDNKWGHLTQLKPQIISILIGTNDLKFKTPDEDFRIALDQLITKCKLLIGSCNIILNRIPHLKEGVILPYRLEMNNTIDAYNQIIENLSKSEGILLNEFSMQINYTDDGVHLNSAGSQSWGVKLGDSILDLRRGA